jgi:hypothetical protein
LVKRVFLFELLRRYTYRYTKKVFSNCIERKFMELIETSVFTKRIDQLLDDRTYAEFREYLVCNPLKGKLIKHGGGIRKMIKEF